MMICVSCCWLLQSIFFMFGAIDGICKPNVFFVMLLYFVAFSCTNKRVACFFCLQTNKHKAFHVSCPYVCFDLWTWHIFFLKKKQKKIVQNHFWIVRNKTPKNNKQTNKQANKPNLIKCCINK